MNVHAMKYVASTTSSSYHEGVILWNIKYTYWNSNAYHDGTAVTKVSDEFITSDFKNTT